MKNKQFFQTNKGFTILEILVVVAVISVIASTILLNTNFHRPLNDLKVHAENLGKTLKVLMQEAILEDKNFALSLTPESYMVLEYDGQEWAPSKDKFLLSLQKKHKYNDELIIDGNIISIQVTEKPEPHILILSSGEMTVFEWVIEDRENNLRVKLNSSMLGSITIEGPTETFLK